MKKWVVVTLLLCLVGVFSAVNHRSGAAESPLKVTSGSLYRLGVFSPEMGDTMTVDVWTPDGYDRGGKYPVIYMHDGQNLFDASSTWNHQAWEIDSVAGLLMAAGEVPQAIIVGIHSVDSTRLGDLMPKRPLQYLQNDTIKDFIAMMCRGKYRADEYIAFIANTLRPVVNEEFAADTAQASTAIMGSSMGGLISIYAMCEYPETFGAAACLSTHWTGALGGNEDFPGSMSRYLIEKLPRDTVHRLYMDNGDCPYDSVYIPYYNRMAALADSLGYRDGRLLTGLHRGHSHSEQSWAARVNIPIKYLLNNNK